MSAPTDAIDADFRPLAVQAAAPLAAPQLLDALRPAERVALMAEIATVVKDVIEKQKWFKQIGPKKHILIQGWTFIGGLGGCSAKTTETEKIEGGFKAHAVVVRVDSGVEVGSADQVCMASEANWKGKDDYALIGMASTRACSRALSTVFRHVVELAGYSATPAEEMTHDDKPLRAPQGNPDDLADAYTAQAARTRPAPRNEPPAPSTPPAPPANTEADAKKRRALRTSINVNCRVLWPTKAECDTNRHLAERLHRVSGLGDDVLDSVPMEALESLQRDIARRSNGSAEATARSIERDEEDAMWDALDRAR